MTYKSVISLHLEANQVSKSECARTPFFNLVLIVYVKYYEYWTIFDEATAVQIWRVFSEAHCGCFECFVYACMWVCVFSVSLIITIIV